ncbi:MAG: hypothetical protein ABIV47_22970 [Roseiflexaceae bacterium]
MTAFLLPLATHSSWAGQQSIALAPGDKLTVTCPTGMGGAAPGTQAQLTCAAPPPTAVPTTVAGPTITGFSGVQEDQTLSGKIAIIAQIAGDKIAKVVFQLDGPKPVTFTEKTAPYTFMGDLKGVPNGWDSTQSPDGDYMLSAIATNTIGQSSTAMIHFHIRNSSQPVPTAAPTSMPAPTVAPTEVPTPATSGTGKTFVETFDGSPAGPQAWRPTNWDVAIHSRSTAALAALEPMHAMHGSDCGAPPATHDISAYEDAVFQCRDHLMTAINATDYGVIYLTPNQQVDFSTGEAVISWDMSTLRTSGRDWVDLWITPFADNLELPLQDWLPDLSGPPRNAIHLFMSVQGDDTVWKAETIKDFVATEVANGNWWTGWRTFLTESASRRDKFELRISRDHLKFGMPGYNFYWLDAPIPQQSWGQGVVQLGHHSYNPTKSDGCGSVCQPNTWHWDNFSISPAIPFTLLRADRRAADATNAQVGFPAPAPAKAYLRFAGIGSNLSVSFDAGKTWQPATQQMQMKSVGDHFNSYWMPIPAGATSAMFRGVDWWGGRWLVRDISVWAQ